MLPTLESHAARTRVALALFALVASLLLSPPALAQRDAVISGRVVDPEGNPVAGALVVISSADRGDSRELRTGDDGAFLGRGFRPAENYVVRVQADGFGTAEQSVRSHLGMNTVDFTLAPATVAADVDYEALNALYDQGFAAWQAQDWAEAERLMSELLEGIEPLEGEDVATMRGSATEVLGVAYLEQDKVDESIAVFQSVIDADPDSLSGHTWLAQGYTRKGDYESASGHLQAAARLAPDNAEVQYNSGAVLLQIGDVEPGIAAMERAIELRPEFPVAYKNLGYAYLRVQKYAEAIEMLETYLAQSPEAPDSADVQGMIETIRSQIQ